MQIQTHFAVDSDVNDSKYACFISSVRFTHNGEADRSLTSQAIGSKFALIAAEMPLSCGEMI